MSRDDNKLEKFEKCLRRNPAGEIFEVGLYHVDANWSEFEGAAELATTKTLMVYVSSIDDDGVTTLFRQMPGLESCYLTECPNVTDGSVDALIGLRSLKMLAVASTNISTRGIKRLRDSLPDAEVVA